ncbi:stage II sporulation protein M [Alkaliphilus crotonatoxidans]
MPNRIIEFIKKHVRDHLAIYFFVFFCFLIGISVGAFTVKAVDGHQKLELVTYLRGFFQLFDHNSPKGFDIFKQSINNNLQLLFLNWLMGILIVGLPFIFLIIGFKGFVMGFTVGLLIEEFKLQGILLFLFAVLPHQILIIPAFLFIAVCSVSFSLSFIKSRINKTRAFHFSKKLIAYSYIHLMAALVMVFAALIESFIVPFFIKLIVRATGA